MSDGSLPERGSEALPQRHDLDRVRELAEGVLPAGERDDLLARARADRELGDLLHAAEGLAAVLGPPSPGGEACRLRFEDVERHIARAERAQREKVRWGRWAAAAALLGALSWAAWSSSEPAAAPTVRLLAITTPPDAPSQDPGAEAALASVELLADHAPLPDGGVPWITSLKEGRAAARATGRPLLLCIYHPVCPICAELERVQLSDTEVRARIASFIPVKVLTRFEDVDPEIDRDWPYVAVLSPEGLVLDELPIPATNPEFVAFLDDQIARRLPAAAAPWEQVRERAGRLREALRLDRRHEAGRSQHLLTALASDPEAGAFAAAASAVLARRARDAYERLRDAAVAYGVLEDRGTALRMLEQAAAELAGTPYAADFAAVRDALERSRQFPHLDPAPLPPR